MSKYFIFLGLNMESKYYLQLRYTIVLGKTFFFFFLDNNCEITVDNKDIYTKRPPRTKRTTF